MKIFKILDFMRLYNIIKDKAMSVKTAYKFHQLVEKLRPEQEFYESRLQQILAKYGQVDSEGNFIYTDNGAGIKIKEDMLADCQSEINELSSLEIDLPPIRFSLDELEGLDLPLSQLEVLFDFVEE